MAGRAREVERHNGGHLMLIGGLQALVQRPIELRAGLVRWLGPTAFRVTRRVWASVATPPRLAHRLDRKSVV